MSRQCLQLFRLSSTPGEAMDRILREKTIRGSSRRVIDYTRN